MTTIQEKNIEFEIGEKVHYSPNYGKPENGVVKSIGRNVIFVVYKCNSEWNRYYDFTGQATDPADLRHGWQPTI